MKTMERKNFDEILREYEKQAINRNGKNETEFTTALQTLATACTFSVLKKLFDISANPTIKSLRLGLARDLNHLSNLENASNNSSKLEFNENGMLLSVITDKSLHTAFNEIISENLSDGIDLVQVASLVILDETQKAFANGRIKHFMEAPYQVRRLKKKVYIQDINSLGGYETTNTTPIQEIFKAIRREITNSQAVKSASNKFVYLNELLVDTETDTTETVYRRLPKYSGLATETTDINGKVTSITADETSTRELDELIANLNLTDKQATILQLRLNGYGYKAIATYLGISKTSVTSQLLNIRKKATENGLKA